MRKGGVKDAIPRLHNLRRHHTIVIPIARNERGIPLIVAEGITSSAVGHGDLSLRFEMTVCYGSFSY